MGSVFINIYLSEKPGVVNFKVSETGTGKASDKRAFRFEVFQQADLSTRRKFRKTVINLSIGKELSHLLQDEINFRSKTRKGSEIILTIPFKINFFKM